MNSPKSDETQRYKQCEFNIVKRVKCEKLECEYVNVSGMLWTSWQPAVSPSHQRCSCIICDNDKLALRIPFGPLQQMPTLLSLNPTNRPYTNTYTTSNPLTPIAFVPNAVPKRFRLLFILIYKPWFNYNKNGLFF